MDLKFAGKRAFISRSTQGTGNAVALVLTKVGAAVKVNGLDAKKLSASIEALRQEVPAAAIDGIVADFAYSGQVELF